MSIKQLETRDDVVEDQDRLGFSVNESDIYLWTIENAYLDMSDSGAMSLNLSLYDETGATLRDVQWLTSGNEKGNSNTYVDKRSGKEHYLPGFNIGNAISMFTLNKEIANASVTKKTLKLYDRETKKDTPQVKPVITGMIGKQIKLGVLKIVQNKRVNKDGKYVDTNDEITINEVDKVFCPESERTVAEMKAGDEEATFADKWRDRNTGNTINKFKEVKGAGGSKKDTGGSKKQDLFAS